MKSRLWCGVFWDCLLKFKQVVCSMTVWAIWVMFKFLQIIICIIWRAHLFHRRSFCSKLTPGLSARWGGWGPCCRDRAPPASVCWPAPADWSPWPAWGCVWPPSPCPQPPPPPTASPSPGSERSGSPPRPQPRSGNTGNWKKGQHLIKLQMW